ncbi:MAG TPA: hypothetical protein VHE37_04310 [Nevskiaceae bacterium]|nr:hypothetical protein [Nevskiaceae bacterium]
MGRALLRPLLCLTLIVCILASGQSPASLTLVTGASGFFVVIYTQLARGSRAVALGWVLLVTFVLPVAMLFALSHQAVGSWGDSIVYLGRSIRDHGVVTSLVTLTAPSAAAGIAAMLVSRHAL